VSPVLAAALEPHDGREIVFGVGSDGSVVMEELSDLKAPALEAVIPTGVTAPPNGKLEPPVPDLTIDRPITLAGLRAGMAGTVVGPKAANLGELASHFPGRVEQAVAIPFGVFTDHVSDGEDSPKAKLDRAYARHRAGELDDAGLAAEIAAVCEQVAAIELQPGFAAELDAVMAEVFGVPGSYGVFVRSDTNVEDLPGFTGAGLNETIANVVDPAAQRRAIAKVWASPYRERAVAWRAPLLTRPEEVYTSVLMMKSVPADKSGVLVTADLVRRLPGLTVATAWGVGGAVDGDAAETLVLEPDGGVLVVGEAKAPYRRRLKATGGVEWVPAAAGAVLTADEQTALRELAAEVAARLEPETGADGLPLPWDIEFGFVGGRLELFQIRPLVERGSARADRALAALAPRTGATFTSVPLAGLIAVRDIPMEPDAR
jgi:phosphoenolpyruvate synthase/pyruvate phosphate dikinase